MSELYAVLLILMVGQLGTLALTVLTYVASSWHARRHRHVARPEFPDNLFYMGLAITWVIAAAVGHYIYP